MARKKLGLIHTSASLVGVFSELCQELLPNVDVFDIADDSLIRDIIACGSLSPDVSRRIGGHVQNAELAGADLVMVTCSSVGPAVEAAQTSATVPVVRVDQAMADHAIAIATRIGVIATLATTLEPTVDFIERRATLAGKVVEVTAHLCNGAFEALLRGDTSTHDRMVCAALEELIKDVDAIVLAQASMARVVQLLPAESVTRPILSSPRMAIQSLVERLK